MPANRIVKFGSYYLTSKIATGGMAEIFRGRKVGAAGFEKLVVIKRLLPHLAADEEFRTMFLNEAKLASLLNHQNIVQVYDLGRMDQDDSLEPGQQGTYFIAMEYIFGKSLAEVMRKGQARDVPLPQELAVRIMLAASLGLAYAHGKKGEDGRPLGLVHRDVSPQNILISYEGEVKLVDFGIAKAMSQSSSTRPGVLKGKFAYMAPEQARGQVDQRADIYSLGVVFWEALTGQRLFQGDNEAALLALVLDPRVEPPSRVRPEIPPELDALCLKCLARDPERRFASAQALCEELEAYLYTLKTFPSTYSLRNHLHELFGPEIAEESRQIQAEGESARQAAGLSAGPATSEAPAPPAPSAPLESTRVVPRPAPGGRGMVYVLALAGLALAAGLAWWLWPGPPAPPPPAQMAAAPAAPAPPESPAPPPAPAEQAPAPPPAAPPPDPRLERAQAQVQQGGFDQALAILDQEQAPPGGWGQAGDRLRAQALLGRAMSRLAETPPEALADLDQALGLAPDWAEVHFQAGRVHTRLKNLDQALAAYQKALELDPGLDGAHFNSGYIHLERGRLEQAMASFQTVVDLGSPFAADAQVNLAVCYHKQGKRDEALRHLQAALVLNPNHKLAQSYLDRLRKGGPGAGSSKK